MLKQCYATGHVALSLLPNLQGTKQYGLMANSVNLGPDYLGFNSISSTNLNYSELTFLYPLFPHQ